MVAEGVVDEAEMTGVRTNPLNSRVKLPLFTALSTAELVPELFEITSATIDPLDKSILSMF